MKNYDSLADALDDLRKRGYESDFATETVCLYCGDLDIRFDPQDFHIDEVYRFEKDANPEDNSILFAITSSSGVKGILVDSSGAYAERLSFEMVTKLQDHHPMIPVK